MTNIEGTFSDDVSPYQKGAFRHKDLCKVVYFSQQMRTDQILLFENGERTERQDVSGISRTLEGLGQCDYSEIKSFVQRKNALADSREEFDVNRELCYQFSLLRNFEIEKFCRYLDIPPKKEFVLYNIQSGEILQKFSLMKFKDLVKKRKFIDKFGKMPDIGIGFISSGQYAKFMFLAKLYWFLEGYHKDSEYYEKIFGRRVFSADDALQEGETALIFIDEGEIYYHPEWQRRYLTTLLDMLRLCKEEASLQIVFTTNSPFVISDVMKEDVQYLSDKDKREEFGDTLGQNIHKLLKNNFFMDYTIGEYSRMLIETIIGWATRDRSKVYRENDMNIYNYFDETQNDYEMIRFLVRQIGEPVYRDKLEKMLDELRDSNETAKEYRIQELERQKANLEKEIAQLRGEL